MAKAKTDLLDFKAWFAANGESLLKGWLRAKEDENDEPFTSWVLGEYDLYTNPPDTDEIEDWQYEIPYHGLCDAPSEIEKLLKLPPDAATDPVTATLIHALNEV